MRFLIHLVFLHAMLYLLLIVHMILNFVVLKPAIIINIRQMINVNHRIQHVPQMGYNVQKDFNVVMQQQKQDVSLIFLEIFVNGLVDLIYVRYAIVVQHLTPINQKPNAKPIIPVALRNQGEVVQSNPHAMLQQRNQHAQHQCQEISAIGMNHYLCVEISHAQILLELHIKHVKNQVALVPLMVSVSVQKSIHVSHMEMHYLVLWELMVLAFGLIKNVINILNVTVLN